MVPPCPIPGISVRSGRRVFAPNVVGANQGQPQNPSHNVEGDVISWDIAPSAPAQTDPDTLSCSAPDAGSGAAGHRPTVSRLPEAADGVQNTSGACNSASGSGIPEAPYPLLFQSQDVYSNLHLETEKADIDVHAAVEDRDRSSTEDEPLEAYAASMSWVPFGAPFTDDEIQEKLPKMFYFFLTMLQLEALRSVAKDMSMKRFVPKNILLARVFLTFMRGYRNGEDEVGLLLTGTNESLFECFRERLSEDFVDAEMPTVRHLNDMAHAERASDAPEPHISMVTPPSRAVVKANSVSIVGGSHEEEEKRKEKLAAILRIRTMRPRRLFNENNMELVARLAEKRAEVVRVDGLRAPPPPKHRKTGVGSRRKGGGVEKVAECERNTVPKGVNNASVVVPDVDGAAKCHMSTSEFARLLILLKDDETCRRAFLDSTQVLSREQLDRGVKSSDFWTAVVEPAFNNKDNTLNFDCSPILANVNPSLPPATYRTGDQLSTTFKAFRSKFMIWLHRYEVSGQNDRDFKTFSMEGGLNVDTLLGKRVILCGYISGVDGLQPDEEFLKTIRRMIGKEGEGGYDAKMKPDEECLNKGNEVVCGTRKAKKEHMNGVMQTKFVTALDAITSYYGDKSSKPQDKRKGNGKEQRSEASPVHHRRNVRRSTGTSSGGTRDIDNLLEKQATLLDRVSDAREKLHQCKDDTWMTKRWEKFITSASKRLDKMDEEIELAG